MDTKTETAIYNNYRSALRIANRASRSGSKSSRAAERRNHARRQTVNRYNIPFTELKTIIAKHDELNGITHEHTEQYQYELALDLANKEYRKNPHPCKRINSEGVECGNTENVRVRWNPFELEIYGEHYAMTTCFECYLEVSYDI